MLPYRVIGDDHDFELGNLADYEAAFPEDSRPDRAVFAGHRCILLDIIPAGAGGRDLGLMMRPRNQLLNELPRAEAESQTPIVCIHAYPRDFAADGKPIAKTFADARVPFVDTGHTHSNELLNDGRVVYGATLSSGQIDESEGGAGYTVVTAHYRAKLAVQRDRGQLAFHSDYRPRGSPHGHAPFRSATGATVWLRGNRCGDTRHA